MVAVNRRLLVSDGTRRFPSDADAAGIGWDVLAVGIDAATLVRARGADLKRLGSYRLLEPAIWADDSSREVREYVIPVIHGIPEQADDSGRRLGEPLRQGPDLNWWWLLEIAEKSSLRGSWIQALYVLALVKRAADAQPYDAIWFAGSDATLGAVLSSARGLPPVAGASPKVRLPYSREWLYWIQGLRHLTALCVVRAAARVARWPRAAPTDALLFFTLFPGWWLGAENALPTERFFPGIAERLETRAGYAAWISGGPRRVWKARHAFARTLRRHTIVPLQVHVGLRAALRVLSPTPFLRLRRFRRALLRRGLPLFGPFDVSRLVGREISRSIGGGEFALDRLLYSAACALFERDRPRAILFRFESQPIDRALVYAARGRTRAVGFWHSAIAHCPNYLPFHFPAGSLRPGLEDARAAPNPMPDDMLASGILCRDTLTRQGYPPARIAICGPVRHLQALAVARAGQPRTTLRAALGLSADKLMLFVATSVVPSDAKAMLWAIARSMGHLGDCVLIVRIHPASALSPKELDSLRQAVGSSALKVCDAHENMYEFIAASDVVITGGSTLAFEAIALGVMPVLFENPSAFSASSFVPFEHACFVVRNDEQLQHAIESIRQVGGDVAAKRERWPSLLDEIFGPPAADPQQRFIDSLAPLLGAASCP